MANISPLLTFVALSLMIMAQMLLPRGPRALHMLIGLPVVLAGLSYLFRPVLVPMDPDLAASLTMGAVIGALAISLVYLVRLGRRRAGVP